MNGDYIVVILTSLNLLSAGAYAWSGDWARAGYWIGAFIITGSTLLIGRS